MTNLSINIRYLRKKNEMSQEELASRLGYKSYTTIQKWESGMSEPPVKSVEKMAQIFDVNMNDFVTKRFESDAELFGEFANSFNERRHEKIIKMNLTDSELSLIEKYRFLDDHGKDMTNTVIDKEYDRCKEEAENTVELSEAELENLKLTKYLNDKPTLLVARKKKGD